MNKDQQIIDIAVSMNMESWKILPELISDSTFLGLLTNQEKGILTNIKDNPNNIRGYADYVPDIVSKYYGWLASGGADLVKLKEKIRKFTKEIDESKNDLDYIRKNTQLVSGAAALTTYSKVFSDRAEKHSTNAKLNFKYYSFSLLMLLVVIWTIFFINISDYNFFKEKLAQDIQVKFSIGIYTLKALTLVFFFQISQFFRKNYNAEKHLEEVYYHRSDVLQSLHAVYVSLENQAEKEKIISTGSMFAFERGETGYITTKEGAGSSDGLLEILSKKF